MPNGGPGRAMLKPRRRGRLQNLDFLAIGEAMAELRREESGEYRVGFAGDTFNTAVYCARILGARGRVGYLTRIGADPLSQSFLDMAHGEHVETAGTTVDDTHNLGIYAVATDAKGERSFSYWRENSAARHLFSDESGIVDLPPARIIYLSAITLAILPPIARQRLVDRLSAFAKSGAGVLAFDSNYRPRLWGDATSAREWIGRLWEIADIALPSIDDEMALFGDASEAEVVARFNRRRWTACAIKRGARGPVSPTLAAGRHPAFPRAPRVVDTTAAGDSFNAGYLCAWLAGKSEPECLLAGHELAARVVGHRGAIVPMRDWHKA